MTVTNTSRSVTQTGNGVTTEWSFGFEVPAAGDLVVQTLDTDTLALTTIASTQYSVTGIGAASGGTVTYPTSGSPIASTVKIIISRTVAHTQALDIKNQGGFDPEAFEDQLDLIVMQIQQLADDFSRSIQAPVGDAITAWTLANATSRASQYLFFGSDGSLGLTGTAPAVQYQGAFTSANEPTLRIGGGALQAGDLYFNTTNTRLRVYSGSAWQNGVDSSTAVDIVGMTAIDAVAIDDSWPAYDLSNLANRKVTTQELFDGADKLTALATAPALTDELLILDAAVAKNMTVQELFDSVTNLTAETAPAVGDKLLLYDISGTAAADSITLTNFFKIINGLTEDTSPDTAADYVVTYDNSAALPKKVLLSKFAGGLVTIANNTFSADASWVNTGLGSYSVLALVLVGVSGSSGTQKIRVRVSNDNGSTYLSTGYISSATNNGGRSASTSELLISRNMGAGDVFSGICVIFNWNAASAGYMSSGDNATSGQSAIGGGTTPASGGFDAIELAMTGGNLDAGTAYLVGII